MPLYPMTLYHTTTNIDKVLKEGLKSPKELGESCIGIGQAECSEKMLETISFTADKEMALSFTQDLKFLSRVAKKEIREDNICQYLDKHDARSTNPAPCKLWKSLARSKNKYVKGSWYCYHQNGGKYVYLSDSFPKTHISAYQEQGYGVIPIPEDILPVEPFVTKDKLPEVNRYRAEHNFPLLTWEKVVDDAKGRNICLAPNKIGSKTDNFLDLVKTYISEREQLGRNKDTYILSGAGKLREIHEDQIGVLQVEVNIPKSRDDLQNDWEKIETMKKGAEYRKADLRYFGSCNVDGVCGIYPFYHEVRVPSKYITKIQKLEE